MAIAELGLAETCEGLTLLNLALALLMNNSANASRVLFKVAALGQLLNH